MAPSLRAILSYAGQLVSQIPLQLNGAVPGGERHAPEVHGVKGPAGVSSTDTMTSHYTPLTGAPSCPINGPTSCSNSTEADSCCFIYPGGRLLLTQFWDQKLHVGGAEEDWTVHGLW